MRKTMVILAIASIAAATPVLAETLVVEKLARDMGATEQRPGRGMTMGQVESGFGAPEARLPAVGEPPITRWNYPGYTVYFEGDRVIHTVVRP